MEIRPRKYRIRITDEAHLVDRGSFTFTWLRLLIVCLVFIAIFVTIGIGIVWFTPLQKRLPGYMPPDQRARMESVYMRVDSIASRYDVHQAYLDNLLKVLDTDRAPEVSDSIINALPRITDTLMVSSEVEMAFIRKMEEAGYVVESDTITEK